jgi:TonB family protein
MLFGWWASEATRRARPSGRPSHGEASTFEVPMSTPRAPLEEREGLIEEVEAWRGPAEESWPDPLGADWVAQEAGKGSEGIRESIAPGERGAPPLWSTPLVAGNLWRGPRSLSRENEPIPYPAQARRMGWEGEVTLEVEVLPGGQVGSVEVKRSSSHPVLDQAALEGIRKWRFDPALVWGRAVFSKVEIPVRFELRY